VYQGQGDRSLAADELGQAQAMFRRMSLVHWLAIAEARQREYG